MDNVIDIDELRDRLEGDMELLKDLADIFITDSIKLLDNLKDAIDNNDLIQISKTAHTIKGAVANFSARKAYDIAYSIERAGKDDKIADIEKTFASLKEEIGNVSKALLELKEKDEF